MERLDLRIDPSSFLDSSFIDAANDYENAEVVNAVDKWRESNRELLAP